jgi:hypothetical protein
MKRIALAALATASFVTVALAAGQNSLLPIVGQPSYCGGQSTGPTGQVCTTTVPAGPSALTGNEISGFDTGFPNGQQPQTIGVPTALLSNYVNRLIGGDMTTNLAQRLSTAKGVTALATLSPTAAVITADRWWVIAPAAGVTATIDSGTTAVIPGQNNTKAIRIARTSSGAAGIVCVGQTLTAADSAPLIGNNAVFSFWEFNGATQSATNGNITVNVDYTSAADVATPTQATLGFAGTNGSLFALGDVGATSAGPTNMTRAIAGVSPGFAGTVSGGVATIPASTTWTKYSVYAPIPTTIPATTTPVTSVSVSICWTPAVTTAVATDYIELNFMQLQPMPAASGVNAIPNGIVSPTAFERRPAALEALLQQYYWYFNYENQSLATAVASCENTATTAANCLVPFPVPMRLPPAAKYTAGFQAFAQVAETSVSACSALAAASTLATVPSNSAAFVQCTAAVGAAGTANQLLTLGTSSATGIMAFSAEP